MSQNPREADAMTKVQAELDETKIVLVSATKINEFQNLMGFLITNYWSPVEYWCTLMADKLSPQCNVLCLFLA